MPPLAEQNNNPGDLREVGQAGSIPGAGGFASFATPQAGIGALLNQVQTNIDNKPNENLIDFSANYAPASDGNDVGQYASNLANQLKVSPLTPISQFANEVPQFAQAVAHNEDSNTPEPQAVATPSKGNGILGGLMAAGGAIAGGVGGLLHTASPALPALGTLAGEALAPETGGLSAIAAPVIGGLVGGEAQNIVNGIPSTPSSTTDIPSTESSTQPDLLNGQSNESSGDTSKASGAFNNALSTTVGGVNVGQEATNRGIGDIGSAAAQMGLLPGVDENGNYDKMSPILLANASNAQDSQYQDEGASQMHSLTSLKDLQDAAIAETKSKMQGSGDLDSAIQKIQKTFEGHSRQHPTQVDYRGNPVNMSQQFVTGKDLLRMKRRASEGENWATPHHERSASQHIQTAMKNKLSEIAKREGVKGWDETNKRMETRFLIKKAIKALPKKAQRDFHKEFLHHLVSGIGGAMIGKTLGNGILGGAAGYLLSSKLEGKKYKTLANKKEQGILKKRAEQKPKSLISTQAPNKEATAKNKKDKVNH